MPSEAENCISFFLSFLVMIVIDRINWEKVWVAWEAKFIRAWEKCEQGWDQARGSWLGIGRHEIGKIENIQIIIKDWLKKWTQSMFIGDHQSQRND